VVVKAFSCAHAGGDIWIGSGQTAPFLKPLAQHRVPMTAAEADHDGEALQKWGR
jgi:hypothetical protein